MKVLVVNCGSSSLKYQLIDSKSESVLASGLCERIGIDGVLNHTPAGHDKIVMTDPLPDHQTAISKVLAALTENADGFVLHMVTFGKHRESVCGEDKPQLTACSSKPKGSPFGALCLRLSFDHWFLILFLAEPPRPPPPPTFGSF